MDNLVHFALILLPFFLSWVATKLDPEDQLMKAEEYDIMLVGMCFLIGVVSLLGAKFLIFQAISLIFLMVANLFLLEMVATIAFFKVKIPTKIPWL